MNIFDPRITAALKAAEGWNAAMDRLETMLGDDDRAAAAAATLVEMTPRELSDAVLREAIASLRRVAIDLRADRDLGAAMRCEQIIREHEATLAARSAARREPSNTELKD